VDFTSSVHYVPRMGILRRKQPLADARLDVKLAISDGPELGAYVGRSTMTYEGEALLLLVAPAAAVHALLLADLEASDPDDGRPVVTMGRSEGKLLPFYARDAALAPVGARPNTQRMRHLVALGGAVAIVLFTNWSVTNSDSSTAGVAWVGVPPAILWWAGCVYLAARVIRLRREAVSVVNDASLLALLVALPVVVAVASATVRP
jgi:hypothetical protein